MVGILVQLAISWLIIWLYENNDLRVLGFFPSRSRIIDFFLFFFITALCCASGFLLKIYFSNLRYNLNPDLSIDLILKGLWWNIKSVLFEELIFRGVIFYILIRKLGVLKAILISSIAFGIYHWFSFGIIGNIPAMIFTFFLTGIMGLLYAYGYSKTFSLYIPSAIHLGWNFTQNFVFSDGPIGAGILKPSSEFRTDSYAIFFTVLLLPFLTTLFLNYYLLKKKKQANPPLPPRLKNIHIETSQSA